MYHLLDTGGAPHLDDPYNVNMLTCLHESRNPAEVQTWLNYPTGCWERSCPHCWRLVLGEEGEIFLELHNISLNKCCATPAKSKGAIQALHNEWKYFHSSILLIGNECKANRERAMRKIGTYPPDTACPAHTHMTCSRI